MDWHHCIAVTVLRLRVTQQQQYLVCMQMIARPMYSNPPLHGALLVKEILGNNDLKQQ